MIALAPMPREGWPRGWWLSPGGDVVLWCIHPGTHKRRDTGKRIPAGEAVFLTGEPGEVYCSAHAPADPPP